MSDKPHITLNVLPNSGKVDQLKREFAAGPVRELVGPIGGGSTKTAAQQATQERIIAAIRTIFDPEIPLNIYDLGLIYAIDISDDNAVRITMTLTAPGCPVAGELVAQVQRKVQELEEVKSASVNLVWDPPWSRERMSDAALLELGLL
jgi:FeS assembly SUF system protein